MKKFKLIGLTGQSGAGKSTISAMLEQKRAFIINADLLVRELYQPDSLCIKVLSSVFGEDIVLPDGNLNRKKLASIAFSDKKNTQMLNSIVHPFVTDLFLKKVKSTVNQNNSVIIYDAPQLFESGFYVMCDMLIGVVADEEFRIKRICSRDNIDKNLALERIKAQYSEDFFRQNCDYIIENNTDLNSLEKAVNELLEVI